MIYRWQTLSPASSIGAKAAKRESTSLLPAYPEERVEAGRPLRFVWLTALKVCLAPQMPGRNRR